MTTGRIGRIKVHRRNQIGKSGVGASEHFSIYEPMMVPSHNKYNKEKAVLRLPGYGITTKTPYTSQKERNGGYTHKLEGDGPGQKDIATQLQLHPNHY